MKKITQLLFTKWYYIKKTARSRYWRMVFADCGPQVSVYGRIVVHHPDHVSLGAGSTLNEGVFLNARAPIHIGSHVHISPHVIINTGTLEYEQVGKERRHTAKEVVIHDGVWIGSGAIINPGVTIGVNAVIGAGAVVTKNIEANSVAVGVPAVVIKTISVLGDTTE